MASPEIDHTPWRCPGVPLSGRASLLPSVRGSGLWSRAGDWDYLGFEPVSALAGLMTGCSPMASFSKGAGGSGLIGIDLGWHFSHLTHDL